MAHFNFNGKLYKEGVAVVTAGNRGLRYGDGLFETIKWEKGQLLMADEHFSRLWKGMQVLQFEQPRHFDPAALEEQVHALVNKNGHSPAARVRITVFRGEGGLYDPANHFPNYIIETKELPEDSGAWNDNGLVLGIYEGVQKPVDILSNLKHNNFLPYAMAAMAAKKEKWNDAIILNSYGRVCDSTIANVFLIKDGIVITPALTEGCVAGVMRKALLVQMSKQNRATEERAVTVAELLNADELFLTNAIQQIRWVQRIGDKTYGNSHTQQLAASI